MPLRCARSTTRPIIALAVALALLIAAPRHASCTVAPPADLLVDGGPSSPSWSLSSSLSSSSSSRRCRREVQPDETLTPPLCLGGDEACPHWTHVVRVVPSPSSTESRPASDGRGDHDDDDHAIEEAQSGGRHYTVVRDDGGWFVYVETPPPFNSTSASASFNATASRTAAIDRNAPASAAGAGAEAATLLSGGHYAAPRSSPSWSVGSADRSTPPPLRVAADSDPIVLGLAPDAPPPCEEDRTRREEDDMDAENGLAAASVGALRTSGGAESEQPPPQYVGLWRILVLPVRFAGQVSDPLPTPTDLDNLFNHVGPHPVSAPGGSVRDFFLESSFNKFDLRGVVPNRWLDLPETEEYYADSKFGHTGRMKDALVSALEMLQDDPGFEYEKPSAEGATGWNGDWLGAVILHSGYAAEWGGIDCHNATYFDRIWSFLSGGPADGWSNTKGDGGSSFDGPFAVTSAKWGFACGLGMQKLGPPVHEIGHMLHLADLYGSDGFGVGSHDFMGNSWGWGGHTESPTTMSAYHRIKMGWIEPVVLDETSGGRYEVGPGTAYKVTAGYPDGEYLLIENRQPVGFDKFIGPGGLAIWHVNEHRAFHEPGAHPWEEGWPRNAGAKGSRLTLLQADEQFHLERNLNRGDGNDFFRNRGPGGARPTRVGLRGGGFHADGGPFPNTDSYGGKEGGGGAPERTGVRIYSITRSQTTMKFSFSYWDPKVPTTTTTAAPFQRRSKDSSDTVEDLHDRVRHESVLDI